VARVARGVVLRHTYSSINRLVVDDVA